MVLDKETAQKTAAQLLQINAIKLNPESPFTWASGWKSPIYCDNRTILSYPEVRRFVAQRMAEQIREQYKNIDAIAGVATGAIGIGMLVADALELPFVYVRPKPKAHGRQNQIEGYLPENSSVVVVEDLISTGGSSLKAVDALKSSGAKVLGMIAIFTYGFPVATTNFEEAGVQLNTLSDYTHLLELAAATDYVKKEQLETLRDWRKDPSQWKA
ncbi:orotate phosphoribosyltransferase [Sediminicola luteus]|uniref:Orotate phosphoribosyltransferase n=1 Tax=Sediminicola luteus TaxID=319238 RepID=A0A2A4G670_9FLAO|nr:orotate phosphoribosyltransferase [Sediminicola luteus]PCE63480.1 orotate phosphoribosyltransferase [Sediminicola luteus]